MLQLGQVHASLFVVNLIYRGEEDLLWIDSRMVINRYFGGGRCRYLARFHPVHVQSSQVQLLQQTVLLQRMLIVIRLERLYRQQGLCNIPRNLLIELDIDDVLLHGVAVREDVDLLKAVRVRRLGICDNRGTLRVVLNVWHLLMASGELGVEEIEVVAFDT